ncbi:MAG: YqgE/AlgH family protein [Candidatus Latescibacteria bacterium]|nr:YqgE/AlgH family protein [Candidatus Latescibacterota bacterium]
MSTLLAPGVFLIASPKLDQNPHFACKVVLILRHTPEAGAAGVVINQPLDQGRAAEQQPLAAGLEHLQAAAGGLFFQGGPMGQESLVVLHRVAHLGQGPPIVEGLYASGDLEALRAHAATTDPQGPVLRFYLGFATWSQGQLEKEVGAACWSLSPGSVDLVFSTEPEQIWQQARGRE